MASNGKLPDSALMVVGVGWLEKGAGLRFKAMQQEARRRGMAVPELGGPRSGYRKYEDQVHFWNLYQSGRGNLAARPGTSNHGLGRAGDLREPPMRETVNKIGAEFGWKKVEAPSEWWHVNYVGGGKIGSCWPLEHGCQGKKVARYQTLLIQIGYKIEADGDFGGMTEDAVQEFQAKHRLEADGKIGPATRKALIAAAFKRPIALPAPKEPKKPRKLSKKGAAFIAKHEGVVLSLYNDPTGHCTIGAGHLVHLGRCNGSEPRTWLDGITKKEAVQLLHKDGQRFADGLTEMVKVPLNQHEFDALLSWAFNVGLDAVKKSTLLLLLNNGDRSSVPAQLARWNKGDGRVLAGLTKRRTAEATLFTEGKY